MGLTKVDEVITKMIIGFKSMIKDQPFVISLLKNFSWTLVGNLIYTTCQWGILVILAKLGTPEKVGLYALGLAVTAPIVLFTNLQLREIQATDINNDFHFNDYLILRILSITTALLMIVILTIIGNFRSREILVILIIALSKGFESLSDLLYGLFQKQDRMERISISKIIRGLFSVTAIGVSMYVTGNVVISMVALASTWGLVLFFYDVPGALTVLKEQKAKNYKNELMLMKPKTSIIKLRTLALTALPLGIVGLLDTLNTNIPRYFIQYYHGVATLGYFSAISYIMMAGGTLMAALGMAATPQLARSFSENKVEFRKLMWILTGIASFIGLTGVIVALLFGKLVLQLAYKPEYAQYSYIFVLVMVAAFIWYIAHVLWCGMTAARYFKGQTPIFIAMVLASTTSSFILVPRYGLTGAALALIIGMFVRLLGSIIVMYKIFINLNLKN